MNIFVCIILNPWELRVDATAVDKMEMFYFLIETQFLHFRWQLPHYS